MPQHPYFDLELLDDVTLNLYLAAPIVSRQTIHEWPLSCVQRLQCCDGTQYIYKSQAQPSVEASVYRTVNAPHLLPATVIDDQHLVLPFMSASIPTEAPADIAQRVLTLIASMPQHTPVYRRLDTVQVWQHAMDATITALRQLVTTKTFTQLTHADIDAIAERAQHRDLYALWQGPIGVVHGDLSATNLLHTPTHSYVIDWQRPLYAPTVMDRWTIEQTLHLPPTTPPMAGALCALHEIIWLTEAATHWFPAGADHYDGQITALTQQR